MFQGKSLTPNSVNGISMTRMTVDRSERDSPFAPYQCILADDTQAYARLTPGYPAYTRDNCIAAKKQAWVVDNFNCSLIYFVPVPGTKYCGPTKTTLIYFDRYSVHKIWKYSAVFLKLESWKRMFIFSLVHFFATNLQNLSTVFFYLRICYITVDICLIFSPVFKTFCFTLRYVTLQLIYA